MANHDVLVNGMALNNQGLTDTNTVNGYGINTFGLVWECAEFWFGPYYSSGTTAISTTWSLCTGVTTTNWSLYVGATTTSWSLFTTSYQGCNEF